MNPPTVRVVYLTDTAEAHPRAADVRPLPVQAQVPLPLLAAIGERLAASTARMQEEAAKARPSESPCASVVDELARLERFGLQLQELAQVAARAQQLRHESVDLGLALLQTVAEWSAEADRLGVELHGPACSEPVHANPAALKHLLDLMVEHALQQGRAVRLEVEVPASGTAVSVVVTVSSEPASQSPERETQAWMTLQWFARALGLAPVREVVARGERLTFSLPRI
ncbi:MAG: hypothetical protein HZC37_16380 [Burkholderiales bacterium]|nr:hypothetical protein [Burkholderiales bacterium]